MKKIIWTALALAALAFAQDKEVAPKVIPIHYVNVNRLAQLINNIPGVSVKADETMHVLVISGRPDGVAAIEEVIKKLDVPEPKSPDFELTGYLVTGSPQVRPDDVPADLNATVKQLHGLFSYKSYRVLETFVLRGGTQRGDRFTNGSTSGILPGTTSDYSFYYQNAIVANTTPRSVHLMNMRLNIQTPTTYRNKNGELEHRSVGISNDIDIPEGQKVVVGKSNFTGGDDALILVLSAKILDK